MRTMEMRKGTACEMYSDGAVLSMRGRCRRSCLNYWISRERLSDAERCGVVLYEECSVRGQLLAVTPEVAHQRLDADAMDDDGKRDHDQRQLDEFKGQ